ncbi:ACT domain-containing protein [Desulfovibrio litoralis]|uniref:ACT domain protein n=1 Tax=Desulfovibrio litoralis DSM 11393 TaxID=1121455 RepID=A0A1M7T8H3_9BACT|nr:ACT domain-containing protein [Desulfovibrio litoralis]SHN66977.1 ACT domain protein [Desulfovibrio litoralis DSM 11393]
MKIQQISIFLENKSGRLADVTHTLYEAGLNMRALSLADTNEFGILRMIVDNPERAKEVLKAAGFTVNIASVIALEVPNSPGGLDNILQMFSQKGVNVEYMYAFASLCDDKAVLIIRIDNTDLGIQELQACGCTLLPQSKILK